MSVKLICYLSFGYPDIEQSLDRAKVYVQGGCDCLEVDLPTDNAFMDSEFIASRMTAAYRTCSDFDRYFEGVRRLKAEHRDTKLIFLAYEHTILEIGVEKFIEATAELGIRDLILVGLSDESVKQTLINAGIQISCYVSFAMTDAEIQSAKASNGFVYMQSKHQCVNDESGRTLEHCIKRLRQEGIKRLIYCGVGVSSPEDIQRIRLAGGDGAFIGSALIKQESAADACSFLAAMKRQA